MPSTDAERVEFMKRFFALGSPRHMEWRKEVLETGNLIAIYINNYVWAQELVIDEIDRVKKLQGNQEAALLRLGQQLARGSTPLAFTTMQTKLKDHPNYTYLIESVIIRNLEDTPTSYPFSVVYMALESDEKFVRDVAREMVRSAFQRPQLRTLEAWSRALFERYKREPAELEMLKDPIAEEIRLQDPGSSLILFPVVRKLVAARTTPQ